MVSRPPTTGEEKRFVVDCDGCAFERTAEGRDAATSIGQHHRRQTGHDIVAVETPQPVEPD